MVILVEQFKRDDAYTRTVAHGVVNVLGIVAQRPAVDTLFLATATRSGEIETVAAGRFV